MRVYNFSAGPSVLPEEVLKQVQAEMLDYEGSGMSVTEMSHRGKWFSAIAAEAEQGLRDLLNIGDDYHVIFVQGGASTQFEAVPLNLLGKNNKADYLVTGNFATKAYKEAKNTAISVKRQAARKPTSLISPRISPSARTPRTFI